MLGAVKAAASPLDNLPMNRLATVASGARPIACLSYSRKQKPSDGNELVDASLPEPIDEKCAPASMVSARRRLSRRVDAGLPHGPTPWVYDLCGLRIAEDVPLSSASW